MALTDPSARLAPDSSTPRSRWYGARMSLEGFLALPEEKPPLEWQDGIVTQKRIPKPDMRRHRGDDTAVLRRSLGDLGIPPDIAVEIISPDQTVRELLEKCLRYAEVGVAISLVVDPDDETVYAIRPGQPLRVLRGDDRIDLDDVLPGFDLTVRALFDSIVPDWLRGDDTPD